MRKQLLFSCMALSATFSLHAQVNMSNTPPPFGTQYTLRTYSGSIADASSGADQVWDYSSINTNAVIGYTVVDPATLPAQIKDTFPTADFAYKMSAPSDLLAAYDFYDNTGTHYVKIGVKSSGSSLNDMRKSDTVIQFNQTYQSMLSYRGMNHIYDGYGSLKVGSKTYNNIVKRKSYVTGSSDTLIQFLQFSPFYHLLFSYAKINGNVQNVVFFELTTSTTSMVNVNELSFKLYPNPTSGNLFIRVTEEQKESELTIIDLQGRVAFTKRIIGSELLDLSQLKRGVYSLNIKHSDGIEVRKIIVQ